MNDILVLGGMFVAWGVIMTLSLRSTKKVNDWVKSEGQRD